MLEKLYSKITPYYSNDLGDLFEWDCVSVLKHIQTESVDTVFADPPFNLKKQYGAKSNDDLEEGEYIEWCKAWIDECVRVLKPGGAIFIYNLPKWNMVLGAYMYSLWLDFRHDITVGMKNCLPPPGRLYPSHYSLLYFTKGKPKTFRKIRTPVELCRHCKNEVKDYGGHRDSINPNGINLTDVWTDIPTVRHWKFKSKDRPANALSTKMLDRVVEMTTKPNDVVLDPFGGSGTTFAVCESKGRRWIWVELDFCPVIKERLELKNVEHHNNTDYIEPDKLPEIQLAA